MVAMDVKARNGVRIIVHDDCCPERGSVRDIELRQHIQRVCDRILRNAALRKLEEEKAHLMMAD